MRIAFDSVILKNLAQRFGAAKNGSVTIMFSLMLVPMLALVGMGIEYGSAVIARSKIQNITDSAALAAGREFQISGDTAAARTKAENYYNAAVGAIMDNDSQFNFPSPSVAIDAVTGTMTIVGTGTMKTRFTRVVNFDQYELGARTEAMLSIGGNDQSIEIAMMLDVTGSMGGSKIADMKVAAKDVVEILVANDQSNHSSRVALAPFSRSVKVGSYYQAVTGYSPVSGSKTCVTERTGSQKFTDAAPGTGAYVKRYNTSYSCKPTSPIVPLTDDKDLLNATIDSFSAGGYTAGHIGTAWAWYLVSPKWNNIWPVESQATDYNQSDTIKAVILLTDGEYNTQYSSNGSSNYQARQLCENMKAEGVVVYTVGFELSASSAIDTMEQCATSNDHYYLAEDGDALKLAFRDIAFKLAQLRLSK